MKRLLVIGVTGGLILVGGGFAYRQVQSVRYAWQQLEDADRAVVEQERQFLVESLNILGHEQEFRDSIGQIQEFRGPIKERQERFVWLSGNVISQLIAKGEPEETVKRLQGFLNRRSILVRRFDKRAEDYRTGCSDGIRARAARWFGACDKELGGPITGALTAINEGPDHQK